LRGLFSITPNGKYKNSSRLRSTFLSSYMKADTGYNA
jgi:hypothetical protein